MKQFNGFPARMEFAPLPNLFFSSLLPQITDMAELKTTLHVLAVIYRKRGYPRFVTYSELLGDASLMSSLRGLAEPPDEVLRSALKMTVERGTFLSLAVEKDGASEDIYFLNDENSRQAVVRIQSGALKLAGLKVIGQVPVEIEEQPNIYKLYEDNMGMLITPMIADELRDAEKLYPQDWIRDAIKEAVLHNKRNIKYIAKILETWATEGKTDGTYQRYSKKTDPDRFIKGKYGHMVRR
jgi:DNA replication protein